MKARLERTVGFEVQGFTFTFILMLGRLPHRIQKALGWLQTSESESMA